MLPQIILLSLALLVQVTFSQKFGLGNSNYGFGSRAPAMSGGGFQVTSYSPISVTGISVVSQNQIEGPLSVGGQLPLQGAVSFESELPSCGSASVNYCCGNQQVGINKLSHGPGPNLHGVGGAGLIGAGLNGPNLFEPNLANPSLTTPTLIGPTVANSAYGANFIGANNVASGPSDVCPTIHHLPSGGSVGLASGVANQGNTRSIEQAISGTSRAPALVNPGISGQIDQGQIVGPGLESRIMAGQGYGCVVNGLH